MDGWMYAWLDGCLDVWMYVCNEWMNECIDGWMDMCMCACTDGSARDRSSCVCMCVHGWMYEGMCIRGSCNFNTGGGGVGRPRCHIPLSILFKMGAESDPFTHVLHLISATGAYVPMYM